MVKEKIKNFLTDWDERGYSNSMLLRQTAFTLYIFLGLLFLGYLALPSPPYPIEVPNSLQSNEPADVETPLRRGYFSDLSRFDVMSHFQEVFSIPQASFIPNFRLNYPPEESQTLIRDQTRSVYLEEIVFPMRESIFVSGYLPSEAKDVIVVNGKAWNQKVIVRYIPSTLQARLPIGIATLALLYLLFIEWKFSSVSFFKIFFPKK